MFQCSNINIYFFYIVIEGKNNFLYVHTRIDYIGKTGTLGTQEQEDEMKEFIAKCAKRLKEWGAPLSGWSCVSVYDATEGEDMNSFEECELCGCAKVRFVHVMSHPDFYENITVGCICAGIMEDDLCAAQKRERKMKNRAKRKKSYLKRKWREVRPSCYFLLYKKKKLMIYRDMCRVVCDEQILTGHHMRLIDAKLAAFDFVDPEERILECEKM